MSPKRNTALRLPVLALAIVLAMPVMAVDLPVDPPADQDDLADVQDQADGHLHDEIDHETDAAEPLETAIELVGDPDREWAIELNGRSDFPAQKTSIQAWSPDGNVQLSDGEAALRGWNLTDGELAEVLHLEPLDATVAQLRISVEVDGGDAYGLNNDYHLTFYRIFEDPDALADLQAHPEELRTHVERALAEVGHNSTALPVFTDRFFAWGNYGVALDDMRGRCCNFTGHPDPPFNNDVPPAFSTSTGEMKPLPAVRVGPVELSAAAVESLMPPALRPTRIVERWTNESMFQKQAGAGAGSGGTSSGGGGTGPTSDPVTVYGYVKLRDPSNSGVQYPCAYCEFQMYDSDGSNAHDFLAVGTTTGSGFFSVTFRTYDGEAAVDPYLHVALRNSWIWVKDENNIEYSYSPGRAEVVNCSSYCNMGTTLIWSGAPTGNYGYEELDAADMDEADMAYYWSDVARQRVHGMNGYTVTRQVTIRLPAESFTGGTHTHNSDTATYHNGLGEIHLGSTLALSPSTIAHEYGHHLMYDMYNGVWPPVAACPSPHYWNAAHNTGCAWTEGWANFWAVHGLYGVTHYFDGSSQPETRYVKSSGSWWDIESLSSAQGLVFATGDAVEGNVAATLWDLVDGGQDWRSGRQDLTDYTVHGDLLPVMRSGTTHSSLQDFYNGWRLSKASASDRAAFRDVAQMNTVDTSGWAP